MKGQHQTKLYGISIAGNYGDKTLLVILHDSRQFARSPCVHLGSPHIQNHVPG